MFIGSVSVKNEKEESHNSQPERLRRFLEGTLNSVQTPSKRVQTHESHGERESRETTDDSEIGSHG